MNEAKKRRRAVTRRHVTVNAVSMRWFNTRR